MKWGRFQYQDETFWGEVVGQTVYRLLLKDRSSIQFTRTDQKFQLQDLKVQTPVSPSKIIGIGDNYPRSPNDLNKPVIFEKPLQSLSSQNAPVVLPSGKNTWPEPEIGIVIGKSLSSDSSWPLEDIIHGYVILNDVTAVSAENTLDTHSFESKGQKNFCIIGDLVETDFNYGEAFVQGFINGSLYREGNISHMKWGLAKIVEEVRKKYQLQPFDIIMSGCPPRVLNTKTFLKNNDVFEANIPGLGTLTTRFIDS